MATRRMIVRPTPRSIAAYVKRNAARVRQAQRPMHGKMESVRQADYRGHHIVIRTRYQIEVDGRMLMGHMGVTNDGQVHYHPVPNLSFASAIENFHVADTRGALTPAAASATGPSGDWENEIHPSAAGYRKLAERVSPVVRDRCCSRAT